VILSILEFRWILILILKLAFTDEQRKLIEKAYQGPDEEELDKELSLHGRDIKKLMKSTWLNDTVVNAYAELICRKEDAVYLNSHLYPKLRKKGPEAASLAKWQKKTDIFRKRFLIVPVFLSAHWTLLLVDHQEKKISYVDSFHNTTEDFYTIFEPWFKRQWKIRKPKEEYIAYGEDRVLVMQ